MRTAIFQANCRYLGNICQFAAQAAKDAGLDESAVNAVELAVDEACSNIIDHAYGQDNEGLIECACNEADDQFTVILRDHGKPFDPSSLAKPNLSTSVKHRQIGGLGVYMMRQLMDEIHFELLGDAGNQLTMIKRKKQKKKSKPVAKPSPWRQIIHLGERVLEIDSLGGQRDAILGSAECLFNGRASLWLDEKSFHIPGPDHDPLFTPQPSEGLMQKAYRGGKTCFQNDFLKAAAVPLQHKERILGVLHLEWTQSVSFRDVDLDLIDDFAAHAALALTTAHKIALDHWRYEQMTLVRQVGAQIANMSDVDEMGRRVCGLIQGRLGYPYVQLFSVHPNRRRIIFEAGKGERSEALEGYTLDLDDPQGIIPWVAREGKTIVANDVTRELNYRKSPFPPEDTQAEMTIPLVYNGEVLGVLDLQSDRLNIFTEEDRFLCETLADNIAVAFHNADLYRSERWRRQVADSLREVTGLLSANASVDDVLDAILRELERALPSDVLAIWLFDGEELHLAHLHGADPLEVEDARHRWKEADAFLTSGITSGIPLIRKPTDPMDPIGVACGYAADYSSIFTALRIGDRPLGVMSLAHHSSRRYGHEAQAVTATFANYAAVTIENARLYDSAQEQAYASAALLQVAQTVATADNLDEILGSIVRITPMLVGVEACSIYLWRTQAFHWITAYGFPEEVRLVLEKEVFTPGEFPLLDVVSERGEVVIGLLQPTIPEDWLETILAQSEEDAFYFMQSGENLLIGFPLMIKGDFFGVMLVEENSDAFRFRQKRIEIITSIAQQVALSIQTENLQHEMVVRERLEHEVQLARQIQQTFLPERLPEYPGWEMAALWKTARQVGGDFYDVIELPKKRLGLIIADVSDKGIPAALFMALTRTLVRVAVSETSSPSKALQRVNTLITPDNQQAMFVTAVYAVLSLDNGRLTYVNAGHNPPLWIRNSRNEVESLIRSGMALGVSEQARYDERTIELEPGDDLLLYTDGLTEAFSPQEELFGVERLYQIIHEHPGSSARALLAAIEGAVNTHIGTHPPEDDLTMLALHRFHLK